MYMVVVRLRGERREAAGGEGEAACWRHALRWCAAPGDGLEHVYAGLDSEVVHLVLWIAAPKPERAEQSARKILDRAVPVVGVLDSSMVGFETESLSVTGWLPRPRTLGAAEPDRADG